MARLNVNATRMVMAQLKSRLEVSKRGYQLLKDKQDELMRRFIQLARDNRTMRLEVEKALEKSFASFSMASAVMSPEMLENALLASKQRLMVAVDVENVMSVRIPTFAFHRYGREEGEEGSTTPYGYVQTSAELDLALEELNRVMDKLLKLTQMEKSAQLMADEIESTRRRVNALEYRTIPDLQETITYIRMKLDEEDRATITRLLKIKDLISQAREEGRDDIIARLQTSSVEEEEIKQPAPANREVVASSEEVIAPDKAPQAEEKKPEKKAKKDKVRIRAKADGSFQVMEKEAEKKKEKAGAKKAAPKKTASKKTVPKKTKQADPAKAEKKKETGAKAPKKAPKKEPKKEPSKELKKEPKEVKDAHTGVVKAGQVASSDTLSEATKSVIANLRNN